MLKCDSSFQCWTCSTDCQLKQVFELPEPIFMYSINKALKANAGLMLAKGIPFQEVEKEKTILILTLITSRMKYLESISN